MNTYYTPVFRSNYVDSCSRQICSVLAYKWVLKQYSCSISVNWIVKHEPHDEFFYQKMNLQFAVILLSYDYMLWGLSQSQLSWQWRYSNFVNLQKRLQLFDSRKRMYTKEYIRTITNMPTMFVVFYELVNRGRFKCFNVTIDNQRPTGQIWPAHYFCLASENKKKILSTQYNNLIWSVTNFLHLLKRNYCFYIIKTFVHIC